jgi:hypothetical protein
MKNPHTLLSMKGIILTCLVSVNLLPFLSCNGNDPAPRDAKDSYAPSHVQLPREKKGNSARRQVRSDRLWLVVPDWRVSYYAHARSTPWWPGAPGE